MHDPLPPPYPDQESVAAPRPPRRSRSLANARSAIRKKSPNYRARRALVGLVAVAVVAAGGFVAWRTLQVDSGESSESARWNKIVNVDRITGVVEVYNTDGELEQTREGAGRVTEISAFGSRVALMRSDAIVFHDLSAEANPVEVEIAAGSTLARIANGATFQFVVGNAAGGNVIIVDGLTGESLDVGMLANQTSPRFFVDSLRFNPDGTKFAVADTRNFQTLVIEPDAEAPVFYPDIPVAVSDNFVATAGVIGTSADVGLFDQTGQELTSVRTDPPVGGLFVDNEFLFVASTGGIYRMATDSDKADRLGTVTIPDGDRIVSVRSALDDTRLVVAGQAFEAVVDLTGDILMETSAPIEDADPAEAIPGAPASIVSSDTRCIPAGGATRLTDLSDGSTVVGIAGTQIVRSSADGCSLIINRAGVHSIVGRDAATMLGTAPVEFAPDGRSAVVVPPTGTTELVSTDPDTESVALGTLTGLIAFVQI